MSYNHKNPWKECPEYAAWINMSRMHESEVDYHWRWYKKCPELNQINFTNFRRSVGHRPPGHVLIRLKKEFGFGPGNVRWGTHQENAKLRGPFRKFACSRDEELIAELKKRGYKVT